MTKIVTYALAVMMLLTPGPAARAAQPLPPQELTNIEQSAGAEPASVSADADDGLLSEQTTGADTEGSAAPEENTEAASEENVLPQVDAAPDPAEVPESAPAAGEPAAEEPAAAPEMEAAPEIGAVAEVPMDAAPANAAAQNEESGFTYEVSGGSVTITGYTGSETNLVIPSQIAGMPVTRIGDDAFSEADAIRSAVIPDGVVSIGDRAFYYCGNLASVSLPESLFSIGVHAFHFCKALGSVDLPSSVRNIGDSAFQGCESLRSIVIPEGVTQIGSLTFQNCVALESVTLPRTVQSIASRAFFRCAALKRLTLPNASIGLNAFTTEQVNRTPIPVTHIRFLGTEAAWAGSAVKSLLPGPLQAVVCDDGIVAGVYNLDLGFTISTATSPVYRGQDLAISLTATGSDAYFLAGTTFPVGVQLDGFDPAKTDVTLQDGQGTITGAAGNASLITGHVSTIDGRSISKNLPSIDVLSAEGSIRAVHKGSNPGPENPASVKVGQDYVLTVTGAPAGTSGTLQLSGMEVLECAGGVAEPGDGVNTSVSFSSAQNFSCTVRITKNEPLKASVASPTTYGYETALDGDWEPVLDVTQIEIMRRDAGPLYPGQEIDLIVHAHDAYMNDVSVPFSIALENLERISGEDVLQDGIAEIKCRVADGADTVSACVTQIDHEDLAQASIAPWTEAVSAQLSAAVRAVPAGSTAAADENNAEVRLGEEYVLSIEGAPAVASGKLVLSGMTLVSPAQADKTELEFTAPDTFSCTVRITGSDSSATLKDVNAYGIAISDCTDWAPTLAEPTMVITAVENGPYMAGQPITLIVKATGQDAAALQGKSAELTLQFEGVTPDSKEARFALQNGMAEIPCTIDKDTADESVSVTAAGIYDLQLAAGPVWTANIGEPEITMQAAKDGEAPRKELPEQVVVGEEYMIRLTGSPKGMESTLSLQGMTIVEPEEQRGKSEISFSSLSNASCVVRIADSDSAQAVLKSAAAYELPVDTEGIAWKPEVIKPDLLISCTGQGPFYPGQPIILLVRAAEEYAAELGDDETSLELALTGLEAEEKLIVLKNGVAMIRCTVSSDVYKVAASLTKVNDAPWEDDHVWKAEVGRPAVELHAGTGSETAEGTMPQTVKEGEEYVLSITGEPNAVRGRLVLKGMVLIGEDGQQQNVDAADFACDGTHSFRVRVVGPAPVYAGLEQAAAYGCPVDTSGCEWTPELAAESEPDPAETQAGPTADPDATPAETEQAPTAVPTEPGSSTQPEATPSGAPASSSAAASPSGDQQASPPAALQAAGSETPATQPPSGSQAPQDSATRPADSPQATGPEAPPTAQGTTPGTSAGPNSTQGPAQSSVPAQTASGRPDLVQGDEGTSDWAIDSSDGEWILRVRPLGTTDNYVSGQNVIDSFETAPGTTARVFHANNTLRNPELPIATGHGVFFALPDGSVHKYRVVVMGDVHGNGMHGLHQLVGMAEAYAGKQPLNDLGLIAADLDENGELDLTDIVDAAELYAQYMAEQG